MVRQELKCAKCKRFVPIQDLRYQMYGGSKVLVCTDCLSSSSDKKDKKIEDEIFRTEKKPVKRDIETPSEIDKRISRPSSGPKTYKYQCITCRFTFRRPAHKQVLKCPNCNGTKLLKYSNVSADTLLRIADDKEFDF